MKNLVCALIFTAIFCLARGQTNISYGFDHQHIYDFFLPSQPAEDTKVIVLIHGGAWGMGDKREMAHHVPILREGLPGHYVVNMEYRLGTQERPGYPIQLQDIIICINHLKATLGQETTFALMGMSAGAHLSMLYDYAWDTRLGDDVKVVVNLVGPTDITHPSYSANPLYAQLFFALTGPCRYSECPEIFAEVSPVTHVHSNVAPTIGFYGNLDILIPNSQMPIIRDRLTELGVVNNFTVYNGGHGNWSPEDQLDMMEQTIQFLKSNWK